MEVIPFVPIAAELLASGSDDVEFDEIGLLEENGMEDKKSWQMSSNKRRLKST